MPQTEEPTPTDATGEPDQKFDLDPPSPASESDTFVVPTKTERKTVEFELEEPDSPSARGAYKGTLGAMLGQVHGAVASITHLESVRLTPSEVATADSNMLVLLGPYLKKVKDLKTILAVLSLALLEITVLGRAVGETHARGPHRRSPPAEQAPQYAAPVPNTAPVATPAPGQLGEKQDDGP
jgi:hypothetical protein